MFRDEYVFEFHIVNVCSQRRYVSYERSEQKSVYQLLAKIWSRKFSVKLNSRKSSEKPETFRGSVYCPTMWLIVAQSGENLAWKPKDRFRRRETNAELFSSKLPKLFRATCQSHCAQSWFYLHTGPSSRIFFIPFGAELHSEMHCYSSQTVSLVASRTCVACQIRRIKLQARHLRRR